MRTVEYQRTMYLQMGVIKIPKINRFAIAHPSNGQHLKAHVAADDQQFTSNRC